jgi:hypothetical protein
VKRPNVQYSLYPFLLLDLATEVLKKPGMEPFSFDQVQGWINDNESSITILGRYSYSELVGKIAYAMIIEYIGNGAHEEDLS